MKPLVTLLPKNLSIRFTAISIHESNRCLKNPAFVELKKVEGGP